jgi:hypothetical protein
LNRYYQTLVGRQEKVKRVGKGLLKHANENQSPLKLKLSELLDLIDVQNTRMWCGVNQDQRLGLTCAGGASIAVRDKSDKSDKFER